MRNKITIRERIATRAYYMSINGVAGSPVDHWLAAEAIELTLARKRSAAATKAAASRKLNALVRALAPASSNYVSTAVAMH